MSGKLPPFSSATLWIDAAGASAKPRNRSEWEARFAFWGRRESSTEAERIEAAKRRVAKALELSWLLNTLRWRLVPQGSWHNRTNVRGDSDVDLCVCLQDAFFTEGLPSDARLDEIGLKPLPFTFHKFKAEIIRCLQARYGVPAITLGRKAIHLHQDDLERVSVDVVATFTLRRYGPMSLIGQPKLLAEGVALLTSDDVRITNFPEQHLENGRVFHQQTGRRFKKVVRILKRLRNHMVENPALPEHVKATARATPSFIIECLVYNCSPDCFGHSQLYDDVVAVLSRLQADLAKLFSSTLLNMAPWEWWQEVNRQKPLFDSHQRTTPSQALKFVLVALAYVGV